MSINEGFIGWNTNFYCGDLIPGCNDFNLHPLSFPGDGDYDPDNSICCTTTIMVPGIDGGLHPVWTSLNGTGSTGGISLLTEVNVVANARGTVFGDFGLMDDDDAVNQIPYNNGGMVAGLCCCLNGNGRHGDGTKGFGIFISNGQLALTGFSVALVEFTNGLTQYNILAAQSNVWAVGSYKSLSLEWCVDDAFLKGIYLKGIFNNSVIGELVYTAPGSFRPSNSGSCGKYAIATGRVIIFH